MDYKVERLREKARIKLEEFLKENKVHAWHVSDAYVKDVALNTLQINWKYEHSDYSHSTYQPKTGESIVIIREPPTKFLTTATAATIYLVSSVDFDKGKETLIVSLSRTLTIQYSTKLEKYEIV